MRGLYLCDVINGDALLRVQTRKVTLYREDEIECGRLAEYE